MRNLEHLALRASKSVKMRTLENQTVADFAVADFFSVCRKFLRLHPSVLYQQNTTARPEGISGGADNKALQKGWSSQVHTCTLL